MKYCLPCCMCAALFGFNVTFVTLWNYILSVLYCTVLYCTVLYCTVLYCTVRSCKYFSLIKIAGYGSSNGQGKMGVNADCGSLEPYVFAASI